MVIKRNWSEFSKTEMEESLYHFYPFFMKWAALQGICDNYFSAYHLYQITCNTMRREWEFQQKIKEEEKKDNNFIAT